LSREGFLARTAVLDVFHIGNSCCIGLKCGMMDGVAVRLRYGEIEIEVDDDDGEEWIEVFGGSLG
jgi:hypothetical protein